MKINSPTPLSTVELEVSSNLQVGDTVIFQVVHVPDGPKTASSSIRCLTGDDFCGNSIHMTNVIIRNDRNYGFAWRSLGIFLTPDGKFVGLEVSRCHRDNQLVYCLPAEYITEILNQSGVLRKPQVNLGIIGHESHGKTTLAAAIREVLAEEEKGKAVAFDDPDTAFSKKQRRITNVTDMTAEASQLDGGILVMSATDKLEPQTKDYITLARQLDMKHLVCFLNKLDAVDDPELLDVVEMELRDLLNSSEFHKQKVPIVRGSALSALHGTREKIGKDAILKLIDVADKYIPTRQIEKPLLMSFRDVTTILAGDNLGILIRGLKRDDVDGGQVESQVGTLTAYKMFEAEISIFTKDESRRHTEYFSQYMKTYKSRITYASGRIIPTENVKMVIPGSSAAATFELIQSSPLAIGERFAMWKGGRTVGKGTVLKLIS